jgi:hypothetical protein
MKTDAASLWIRRRSLHDRLVCCHDAVLMVEAARIGGV